MNGISLMIKKIYLLFRKVFLSLKLILFKKRIINTDSYYPEYSEDSKRPIVQLLEMIADVWKDGGINKFYYLYGFDIKNLYNRKDFVLNRTFIVARNRLNINILPPPL